MATEANSIALQTPIFAWVRLPHTGKPTPQKISGFIDTYTKPLIVQRHDLTPETAILTIEELAAMFPFTGSTDAQT